MAPTWMVPLFVHVEPAPDTVAVPCEPRQIANEPAEIGQRPTVLDCERSNPALTDDEISV